MRVVLDANVLIAAFATRGLCNSLLDLCLQSHDLILSQELLREMERNLLRKFKLPEPKVAAIIRYLERQAMIEEPTTVDAGSCRDPGDLHVLGLAVKSRPDCVVTGDQDLLILKTYQGIPILSPREFWTRLRKDE